MFKKVVKFTDYDGNEREETFLFNLTKAEVTELELSVAGGLVRTIEKILEGQDMTRTIEIFKDVMHKSYGVKSEDGRRFIKNQEILDDFTQTEAYSIIFMELATDAEAAAAFMNGVVPKPDKVKPDYPQSK